MNWLSIYVMKSLISYVILLLEERQYQKYNHEECMNRLSKKITNGDSGAKLNIKWHETKADKNEIQIILQILLISFIPYIRVLFIIIYLIGLVIFEYAMSDDK